MDGMAYLNRISPVVPSNDVHQAFIGFARGLLAGQRTAPLFDRLVSRSQIDHRWSVLGYGDGHSEIGAADFYRLGDFPTTGERMAAYARFAPGLAKQAVDGLGLNGAAKDVTHLIVTSCTGLYAPGIDLELIGLCGLDPGVERTVIGFMGCYAAINALRAARHIVRSDPQAKVLVVSLELCSLHLQETTDLEQVLSFLVFADGCAAALVTAEPEGLELTGFKTLLAPAAADQITWKIGDRGFDMFLSGQVPASVGHALRDHQESLLGNASVEEIELWAVHPGGRSVLDAVENALDLPPEAMGASRKVLADYGNMSSATILFVLAQMLREGRSGQRGKAMAFGPGLTAETLSFTVA
jgi:predicted naringenin-chalcone synthase